MYKVWLSHQAAAVLKCVVPRRALSHVSVGSFVMDKGILNDDQGKMRRVRVLSPQSRDRIQNMSFHDMDRFERKRPAGFVVQACSRST